jgi:hypothetical protein
MNQTYGLLVLDADPNDTITYLTNAFQRIVTYS